MEDETQEIQTEVKNKNSDVTNRIKCLNCNTEFEGKFCPECGQSAETDRFTLRFIWDNLLAAVLGRDGGIGYTFKNLFLRPGKMIVEILNGKRRKYLSPFPTLFLALTLYVLIFTATGSKNIAVSSDITIEVSEDPIANDRVVQMVYKLISDGYHFYLNHYTLCYMLTLPLFIIAARKCYGKENRKRYYRAEYIVAIVYAMSILVFYRCVINLIYPISTTIYEKMTFYEPFAMILVLTACFRRMMGFGLAKTIWRSIDNFEGRSSEKTWVWRVATNTMLMLRRKSDRSLATESMDDAVKGEPMIVSNNDSFGQLSQLIDLLPEESGTAIRAFLDGFSYKEIADMTGSTVGAVAMRIARAKRKLKQMYDKENTN